MLNRPLCKRTFPARTASSPTQLSRALTSLRTPDHAVPNDAALCRSRGERVQLSFSYSIPSCRWTWSKRMKVEHSLSPCRRVVGRCRGLSRTPEAYSKPSVLDASLRQGDACNDAPARPCSCSIMQGRKAGETEGWTSCRKETMFASDQAEFESKKRSETEGWTS